MEEYYNDQLAKISLGSEYAPTVSISDAGGNRTNNMDINKGSAKILIQWLKSNMKNFND